MKQALKNIFFIIYVFIGESLYWLRNHFESRAKCRVRINGNHRNLILIVCCTTIMCARSEDDEGKTFKNRYVIIPENGSTRSHIYYTC